MTYQDKRGYTGKYNVCLLTGEHPTGRRKAEHGAVPNVSTTSQPRRLQTVQTWEDPLVGAVEL
jgi:hypothetical protein